MLKKTNKDIYFKKWLYICMISRYVVPFIVSTWVTKHYVKPIGVLFILTMADETKGRFFKLYLGYVDQSRINNGVFSKHDFFSCYNAWSMFPWGAVEAGEAHGKGVEGKGKKSIRKPPRQQWLCVNG